MFKSLAPPTDKHQVLLVSNTRSERCCGVPGHGQLCAGTGRAGALGRPLVPPPALVPAPALVPPPALSLAQPGRAQRGAWLTYFSARPCRGAEPCVPVGGRRKAPVLALRSPHLFHSQSDWY